MVERVTHAGLRRQMHHRIKAPPGIQRLDGLSFRQVDTLEGKARLAAKHLDPGEFQPRIIIVVQAVNGHDLIAAPEQGSGNMKADKSGGTSDKDAHDTSSALLLSRNHGCIGTFRKTLEDHIRR
jgi:hypothetical protein